MKVGGALKGKALGTRLCGNQTTIGFRTGYHHFKVNVTKKKS